MLGEPKVGFLLSLYWARHELGQPHDKDKKPIMGGCLFLSLSPFHRESFYVTGTHLLDDGTVNPGWIARLSGFFFLELMPGGSQEGRRLEEGQGLCETSSEERLSQG